MTVEVPPYQHFLWPALQAVLALGGSASIAELDAAVIDRENLSPEVQSVLHGDGPMTEVQYRLAWARTYLKGMGLLTNSQRGVWSVTELGETVAEDQIPTLRAEYTASRRKKGPKKKGAKSNLDNEIDQADAEAEADWKDALLDTILSISPHAFERLAQRLLREAGVSSPVVTGRAGDGGIDGRGVYQISLLSFPVFFQCKRYSGSVGPFNVFGLLDPLVELADLLGNAHSRLNADHQFTSFSFRPPETGSQDIPASSGEPDDPRPPAPAHVAWRHQASCARCRCDLRRYEPTASILQRSADSSGRGRSVRRSPALAGLATASGRRIVVRLSFNPFRAHSGDNLASPCDMSARSIWGHTSSFLTRRWYKGNY
jgi:restriction system protein